MKDLNQLFQNISIEELLSELNPTKHSTYYHLICPFCGKKEAYIPNKGELKPIIICNRKNKCGQIISIWNYLKQFKGLSNKDIFKLLNLKEENYTIPKNKKSTKIKIRIIQKPLKIPISQKDYNLNDLIQNFKNLDIELKFQTILTYIYQYSLSTNQYFKNLYYKKRKISPPKNIGHLSKKDSYELTQKLLELFDEKRLFKFGIFLKGRFKFIFSHFNVIPSFDIYTNLITALRFRNNLPFKPKELELSYHRFLNPLPYPLTLEKLKKFDTFYFTEGHIDALSLKVPNVVGVEGIGSFKEVNFYYFKDKTIIIAFDKDKAGFEGSLKLAKKAEKYGVKVKFLNWNPRYAKDINELLINGHLNKTYISDNLDFISSINE